MGTLGPTGSLSLLPAKSGGAGHDDQARPQASWGPDQCPTIRAATEASRGGAGEGLKQEGRE